MKTSRFILSAAITLSITICCGCLYAHTVRTHASNYSDNQSVKVWRFSLDSTLKYSHTGEWLSGTNYSLFAAQDYMKGTPSPVEENIKEEKKYDRTKTNTFTLSAGQTWGKLTETRALFSAIDTASSKSRTGSIGVSQWFWHETFQGMIDISRTMVSRETNVYTDVDVVVIEPAPKVNSTGLTLGLKHLASSTTILQYNYTLIHPTDRPDTHTYSLNIKQFLPFWNHAIHVDASRAINRGKITEETTYGEVDAWQWQGSYLISYWETGLTSKVYYRYYKEDQVTRAYSNELVFGSDTYGLNLAYSALSNLIVETGAALYKTNKKTKANIYDAGVQYKF